MKQKYKKLTVKQKEKEAKEYATVSISMYYVFFLIILLNFYGEIQKSNDFNYFFSNYVCLTLFVIFFLIIPLLIYIWCKTSVSRPKLIGMYKKQELIDYTEKNEILPVLENDDIRIIKDTYPVGKCGENYFIRCFHKKKKIFFTIYNDNRLIEKIWIIMQIEFNSKFSYNNLLFWCYENGFLDSNLSLKITQERYN